MIFPDMESNEYKYSNLCSLFWGTIFNVFVWFFLCPIFFGAFIGMICATFFMHPWVFYGMLIFVGILFGVGYWRSHYTPKPSMTRQYIHAWKEKHCPLVEYE
jgi:hypothetical protein